MKQKSFRERLMQPHALAAITAAAWGTLVHLYALVNNLYNYDNITVQPYGFGNGVTSGRWFLSVLGSICDYLNMDYNLPLVNGLLFLFALAVTAGFIVSTLGIQYRSSAVLTGMILVVFPAAVSTMFFRYTAVYYGIAILLAVLSVWVLPRFKYGFLLSILCIACSIGIYQAYVPMTIGLFVLLLLRQTLEGNSSLVELIRKGLYYCASILLGVILYYLILKMSLWIVDKPLSSYQGINNMGNLSLSQLLYLGKEALHYALLFPLRDCYRLNTMFLTKLSYILISLVSAGMLAYLLIKYIRKWSIAFFTGFLCLAFALGINFIVIMCPDSGIYTIMAYSFVLISCFPMVLLECFPQNGEGRCPLPSLLRKGCAFSIALLVFTYSYQDNINYTGMHYANRQVENYCSSLVAQVRMTEGFTSTKKWALLGSPSDPLLYSQWEDAPYYGGFANARELAKAYSFTEWIRNYMGYTPVYLSEEECAALAGDEAVKAMPCYPDYGSIRVLEDVVVIKFQELTG